MSWATRLLVLTHFLLAPASTLLAQSPPIIVRQLLDSLSALHRTRLDCRDFRLEEFEDLGLIRGCVGRQADSVFVAYQSRAGRALVFTTRFFVVGNRLEPTADSVRAAINTMFAPLQCSPSAFPDQYWQLTQWQDGPLTIQVGVNSLPEAPSAFDEPRSSPSIAVQVAAAVLPCGDWIHDPLSK
jgi:hypothetical protein